MENNKELSEIDKRDLDEETLFILSQTFKALGDPARIRILYLLFDRELSVNGIASKAIDRFTSIAFPEKFTVSKVP